MVTLADISTAISSVPWWWPTETVQIAIIAGGSGILSAVVMAFVTYVIAYRQKKADWAREDEVARRVEVARTKAEEAARLLLESNQRVANSAKETNGKLNVIHALVNSNMTATLQTLLDSLNAQLVLMEGSPKSQATTGAIAAMKTRIRELSATLEERRRQDALTAGSQAQQIEETQNDNR